MSLQISTQARRFRHTLIEPAEAVPVCEESVSGEREKVQGGLKEYAAAGAQRFVVGLGDMTPATFEGVLKKVASVYI